MTESKDAKRRFPIRDGLLIAGLPLLGSRIVEKSCAFVQPNAAFPIRRSWTRIRRRQAMRFARRIASLSALAFAVLSAMVCCPSAATEMVPGTPFERRHVRDSAGRDVTYYLAHAKAPKAPILLMIQGSGCAPIIVEQPGSESYSTFFDLLPFGGEGRFVVVAVEKPYAGQTKAQSPGSALGCSSAFNEDFTAESWLVALEKVLGDARKEPFVERTRTLVFGVSEGGVMAALLASHDPLVTDVVSIGASGTTQLFDFIENAYRHCFDASLCLDDLDKQLAAIRSHPQSSTLFAWGHPYKRWTSFFGVDPSEGLLKSKARVYWALGTADESVPPASQEVAIAKLMAAGHDITVRRVPNGTHSLIQLGVRGYDDLDKEMRAALTWFDQFRADGQTR